MLKIENKMLQTRVRTEKYKISYIDIFDIPFGLRIKVGQNNWSGPILRSLMVLSI